MHFPGFKALAGRPSSKQSGDAAETAALRHLQRAGLRLRARNYRTPGRGGGEVDMIMQDIDGTLVFVEVRARRGDGHGGAAASIGAVKRQRIIFAARHYLMAHGGAPPPCRFDVVVFDGDGLQWLRAAFDAS